MQKMLLSLVFAPVWFGVRDRRKCLPIWSELFEPKAGKTSLIDRKSDSFAVAEADLYNAFQVIS